MPARLQALTPTANGSINAPSSVESESGSLNRFNERLNHMLQPVTRKGPIKTGALARVKLTCDTNRQHRGDSLLVLQVNILCINCTCLPCTVRRSCKVYRVQGPLYRL